MFAHLWVDPLHLSCPKDRDQTPLCLYPAVHHTLFRDWDSSHVNLVMFHYW